MEGETGRPAVWHPPDGRAWDALNISGQEAGWLGSAVWWNDHLLTVDDDRRALWRSSDGRQWQNIDMERVLGRNDTWYTIRTAFNEPFTSGRRGAILGDTGFSILLMPSTDAASWNRQPMKAALESDGLIYATALAIGRR